MKTRFLFPASFKTAGWCLLVPAVLVGAISFFLEYQFPFLDLRIFAFYDNQFMGPTAFFSLTQNNLTDELSGILIIVGALLVACSREKHEDEYIAQIRLESLLWATYINYGLLIVAMAFVFGISFFWVLVCNMFTLLIIFLVRFNYILYKNANAVSYEK